MAIQAGQRPVWMNGPQAPQSSGGWDGGKPLQQQPAPPAGGNVTWNPMAAPAGGYGGGSGGAGPAAGMFATSAAGGGGGPPAGTPSWLLPLLATRSAPSAPAAPADPAPLTPQQRMSQNTAMGNQVKAANTWSRPLGPMSGLLVNGLGQQKMNAAGTGQGGMAENVPMAPHLGGVNGPVVAGGIGGGAGGLNGGGTGGAVGASLQSSLNSANAANEKRYQQLLTLSGQLSDSELTREYQNRDSELGRVDQDMISAGLGNSTVLPNLEKGVYDQSALRQQEVADQGIKTAMGIIERRTDAGPDYNALAQMAARPGATGSSYGFPLGGGGYSALPTSGAGYGGGGAAGAGNLYAALAGMVSQKQQGPPGDGFTSSNDNGWGQQVPDGYKHLKANGTYGF